MKATNHIYLCRLQECLHHFFSRHFLIYNYDEETNFNTFGYPFISIGAQAQLSKFITDWNVQITASPYSIQMWGKTPATSKVTVSYGMIELVWFHGFETLTDVQGIMNNSHKVPIGYSQMRVMNGSKQASNYRYGGNYFGVFINPIQYHFWHFDVQGGIGWFFRKIPDIRGAHLNFQFQLTYMLKDWIGISYSHISNGFGLWHEVNSGFDNISIVINF